VFKKRLAAISGETGSKQWKRYLPIIEDVMNNTTLSCLPARVTPNEVWFGRKAWGPSLKVADSEGETDSEDEDSEEEEQLNSEDEAILLSGLSDLSKRVMEKNAKNGEKMVKKGGIKKTYIVGQLVLLAIPPKNRLSTEATRLPCRVIKVVRNAYALLSAHGPLQGLHQGSTLKAVLDGVTFGIPETVGDKVKRITLPSAVTLSNNRKSITAQEKLGTATTKARKEAVAAARLEYDAAEAVAVQDELDERFARETEKAVRKRGGDLARPVGMETGGGTGTPTPAVRNQRKRKAPERYDPPLKEKRARK
jgi:hypothetical protein